MIRIIKENVDYSILQQFRRAWDRFIRYEFGNNQIKVPVIISIQEIEDGVDVELENGESVQLSEDGHYEYYNIDRDEEYENTIGATSTRDANKWLKDKLREYGNTAYFPTEERRELNKLINDFGNTYFWNKS